jgi:UDP-glucuronate 4-epimerase
LRPELALSVFTKAICRDEPFPLFGDGSVRRDFAHISDVVDGICAALAADNIAGEAINLGNNRPHSVRELIALIEEATGKTAKIDFQPTRPEEMPETWASLDKAERLLSYHPRVTLAQGVPDFVAWWRETHE